MCGARLTQVGGRHYPEACCASPRGKRLLRPSGRRPSQGIWAFESMGLSCNLVDIWL